MYKSTWNTIRYYKYIIGKYCIKTNAVFFYNTIITILYSVLILLYDWNITQCVFSESKKLSPYRRYSVGDFQLDSHTLRLAVSKSGFGPFENRLIRTN